MQCWRSLFSDPTGNSMWQGQRFDTWIAYGIRGSTFLDTENWLQEIPAQRWMLRFPAPTIQVTSRDTTFTSPVTSSVWSKPCWAQSNIKQTPPHFHGNVYLACNSDYIADVGRPAWPCNMSWSSHLYPIVNEKSINHPIFHWTHHSIPNFRTNMDQPKSFIQVIDRWFSRGHQ